MSQENGLAQRRDDERESRRDEADVRRQEDSDRREADLREAWRRNHPSESEEGSG